MEFWITENGKRIGPLQEWSVRAKVQSKELSEDDLLWHKDLEHWIRIGDYPSYQSYFNKDVLVNTDSLTESELTLNEENTVNVKHYWARRGFAKIFDLTLYFTLFFIVTNFFGIPFGLSPDYRWMEFIMLIPFFFFEAYLLHRAGVTPGKWLLGLNVTSQDGSSLLSTKKSLIRSSSSWFFGMAMGYSPYFIFSALISYFNTGRRGKTVWDYLSNSQIAASEKLSPLKVIRYFIAFFLVTLLFYSFVHNHGETAAAYLNFVKTNLPELLEKYPELMKQLPAK